MSASVRDAFDLDARVAVITGGAGLLGRRHAEAVAELGGAVVLLDIDGAGAQDRAAEIGSEFGVPAAGLACDITDSLQVTAACEQVLERFKSVDILINNAANNPAVEGEGAATWGRLETLSLETWRADIDVGLTGAFLCARTFGTVMASRGRGVILNVASDLALIGPDQRIYRDPDRPKETQPAKPVTYSVVKSGLLGLTRYLATYWADDGVRANSMSPGGIEAGQDERFVQRLSSLIPLGRMARADEYKAAIAFLVSDASSYMTGANLVIDGGRTAW